MARGQNNGITILLGVKDLKIGEVREYEDKIIVEAFTNKKKKNALTVEQQNSISMEKVDRDKFSILGVEEKEFIWNSSAAWKCRGYTLYPHKIKKWMVFMVKYI